MLRRVRVTVSIKLGTIVKLFFVFGLLTSQVDLKQAPIELILRSIKFLYINNKPNELQRVQALIEKLTIFE